MTGSSVTEFDRQLHRRYGVYTSEPVRDHAPSRGRTVPRRCGPYSAVMIRANNLTSRRPAMQGDWLNSAFLLMQLEGDSDVVHYGKKVALQRGDVFLMDSRSPLQITVPCNSRAACISVGRDDLLALSRSADTLFGSKISGQNGLANLLAHMLNALMKDDYSYRDIECRTVTNAVLSLIDQYLLWNGTFDYSDNTDNRRITAVKQWLAGVLTIPDLEVADIAREFNMSRSALYRLFAASEETPAGWILSQRLMLARDVLSDPRTRHRSITEICFDVGFNDTSHFSRAFRQAFGQPPQEYRSKALLAPI
ncbi:MAG: helix-turn-helix domain-containing protein [Sphingobium sp.]